MAGWPASGRLDYLRRSEHSYGGEFFLLEAISCGYIIFNFTTYIHTSFMVKKLDIPHIRTYQKQTA